VGVVRAAEDGFLCGTGAIRLRVNGDSDDVDPDFLSHVLADPASVEWFKFHAIGATMPNLNEGIIRAFPLVLPPRSEQRAIAHILGAFDDKIDLNRRMSETLESMARALFKSWFVDFDPVKLKSSRNEVLPGSELFPDRLVDSELGTAPEGWTVGTVGDLAEVVGGSTPSTAHPEFWGPQHHWATPKDLASLTTPVLLDTERKITDVGLQQIGSGLSAVGTVMMSSRAPIGYLAITEVPVAVNQGFIAMRPRSGVPSMFLLLWARFNQDVIINRANGSTFLEISKANFRPIPILIPPASVLSAFDKIAEPVFRRIVVAVRESCTLAALRDTLLPKLISGELRVKDAERLAVQAGV
jgi:type I restriction enzyme S subunit